MRRLIAVTSLIVIGCLPTPAAIAQSACRPSDEYAAYLVNNMKALMLNANPHDSASRSSLHVPQVATSEITLVTDSKVCAKVLNAYNAALGPRGRGPTASTQLSVVKVGSERYVAFDPKQKAGEYIYQMTLDGQYRVLVLVGT